MLSEPGPYTATTTAQQPGWPRHTGTSSVVEQEPKQFTAAGVQQHSPPLLRDSLDAASTASSGETAHNRWQAVAAEWNRG